jgi:hypothetical protein
MRSSMADLLPTPIVAHGGLCPLIWINIFAGKGREIAALISPGAIGWPCRIFLVVATAALVGPIVAQRAPVTQFAVRVMRNPAT